VWIERVLLTLYFRKKRKVTAKRLREFAAGYFGPYGGYAQQYLFHHARALKAEAKPRNGKGQTSA
jgi:N-glycosylase/DNA lyase